jgi:hypothetical protein
VLALAEREGLKKRGTRLERGRRDSVLRQLTHPSKKKPSSSSSSSTHLFRSETGNDSDTEAFIDPKLAMYRLHEGVSHASRASDVGELHRLQKSSTKPRHDGKKKDNGSEKSEAKREKQRAPPAIVSSRRCKELPELFYFFRPPRHARDGICARLDGEKSDRRVSIVKMDKGPKKPFSKS